MTFRTSLLTGTMLLALGVASPPTHAQDFAQLGGQAEWLQNYDAGARVRIPRSTTPVLSAQALAATEQTIDLYRDIVARGGWTPIQASGDRMKVGFRGPAVSALRERLIQTGDLDPSAGSSPIYDSYVEAGVRRFQARHGLNTTGALNSSTIAAMNVPAELRLRQLELNAVRLRAYSGNLGQRHVILNIPAAQVETVEDGVVQTRHMAVVGKIDRQSPIMNTKVSEINFHPFWTTPSSIIKKDLIPKMRSEPNYLTENRIRIYSGTGQEVSPSSINWNSNEAMSYRFRQDPGDFNSMGTVRINIPNTHGVYMHDTNSKGLFGDEQRFHSSGCVRVQNVRDYVAWILRDTPGMTRDVVDEAFASGKRLDVKVADPVNVYWTYITAWATPDGLVQFRDDIYNKDGLRAVPMARAADREQEEAVN